MRGPILLLGLVAGLALAGCDSVMTTSGPPPAGSSVGTSASPERQQARENMGNSGNVGSGTPTVSGVDTSGRPITTYTGPTGDAARPEGPRSVCAARPFELS